MMVTLCTQTDDSQKQNSTGGGRPGHLAQRTKMNMKREHMAGGQMVLTVPELITDDHQHHHHHHHRHQNHHRHHQQHRNQSDERGRCASEERPPRVAISLVPCLPDRLDAVDSEDIYDNKLNAIFVCIPAAVSNPTKRASCACQTDSDQDEFVTSPRLPRSPRSPAATHRHPDRADEVAPPSSRRGVPSTVAPPPPPPPPAELQKYENIPVPGIIPRSKVTSSSSPAGESKSSEPITFYSRVACLGRDFDRAAIVEAERRLSASGFYYDRTSVHGAKRMLRSAEVGTFLVRISSQPSHFFALSVKTNRGTTSIRIAYDCGRFRLDADPESAARMPTFDCVISLIEYYVVRSASDARNRCVFLESNGRRDTPVILTRPFRTRPQSLRHLCRRSLHYHFSGINLLQLLDQYSASVQVRQYLDDYPYAL